MFIFLWTIMNYWQFYELVWTIKKQFLSIFHNQLLLGFIFQSLSHVQLFVTPWTAPRLASLFCSISWSLLKLLSIELVMPSNHLIFFC